MAFHFLALVISRKSRRSLHFTLASLFHCSLFFFLSWPVPDVVPLSGAVSAKMSDGGESTISNSSAVSKAADMSHCFPFSKTRVVASVGLSVWETNPPASK